MIEISGNRNSRLFYRKSIPLVTAIKSYLDGFRDRKLTIRQVYYQMVARGYIENSFRSYQNLVALLTKMRKTELIDWEVFEDRARRIDGEFDSFDPSLLDPEREVKEQIKDAFSPKYWFPGKWAGQETYLEIWIEKDALAGFFRPICEEWNIPLVISRGYTSYTFRQEAIRRIDSQDQDSWILYFGDLDPSGWDIYRMLKEELEEAGSGVIRPALNPDQVSKLNLPPMPQKRTDPRQKTFQILFPELGNDCYELDALDPGLLKELINESIKEFFSEDIYQERQEACREWHDKYQEIFSKYKKKFLKIKLNF